MPRRTLYVGIGVATVLLLLSFVFFNNRATAPTFETAQTIEATNTAQTAILLTASVPVLSSEREIAIRHISETYQENAEDIVITNETTYDFPRINKHFVYIAGFSPARGYIVYVDKADGKVVETIDEYIAAEKAATTAVYGNLEPALYAALQTMNDTDTITVIIGGSAPGMGLSELRVAAQNRLAAKYPEVATALRNGRSFMDVSDATIAAQIEGEFYGIIVELQRTYAENLQQALASHQVESRVVVDAPIPSVTSVIAELTKTEIERVAKLPEVGGIELFVIPVVEVTPL